ncbi:MAG: hypothetical protein ABI948_09970, partial [Thermoleophilia bacterium]
MDRLRPTLLRLRPRTLVLALALVVTVAALATIPPRRHQAEALLLVRGDHVDQLANSYSGRIVDRGFLASIRARIRPIDGHRLTESELGSAISAQSVNGAGIVRLTARAKSARGAEALANDVAVAFAVAVKQ